MAKITQAIVAQLIESLKPYYRDSIPLDEWVGLPLFVRDDMPPGEVLFSPSGWTSRDLSTGVITKHPAGVYVGPKDA